MRTKRGFNNFEDLLSQPFLDIDGGAGAGSTPTEPTGDDKKEPVKTYDEDEVQKLIQSEADKRVTEALKTASKKHQEELQAEIKKAMEEAKTYAQLNDDEKKQVEQQKIIEENEALKRQLAMTEMSSEARATLSEKNINVKDELLNLLIGENAETTKAAVDSFIELFEETVETRLKDGRKQSTPKRYGQADISKEDILKIADPQIRLEKIRENKHLFE